MAVHSLALRVWCDACVLATQMGVAVDHSSGFEFARCGTHYEQMGIVLCRSLRRLLWVGSLDARRASWTGAAPRLKMVPAQASLPLKRHQKR